MASLQRYSSHGQPYYRIVESFRRSDGKPAVRVLAHLGKADDLLARLQQQQSAVRVFSVSAGAVQAAFDLASEFGLSEQIDQAVLQSSHKPVQCRDGLTVGQSLTLAAIARLCHPCSKRAIAAWSMQTALPGLFGVEAAVLTSQHFWDQMDALPIPAVAQAERSILRRVVETESLGLRVLAYDTTNFFTHIDSGNTRPQLPQRGHNKQHRHDLRQLGLAMVVSEQGQIPLAHAVYEGSRNGCPQFPAVAGSLTTAVASLATGSCAMHSGVRLGSSQRRQSTAGGRSRGPLRHGVKALIAQSAVGPSVGSTGTGHAGRRRTGTGLAHPTHGEGPDADPGSAAIH